MKPPLPPLTSAARRLLPLLILGVAGVGPITCAGAPRRTPPPVSARPLVLPIGETPRTFNPLTLRDPWTLQVTKFLFDGLTRLEGSTGAPVPALAESWRIDPEGKVYTFQVRSGVRWSDGEEFGPEDVVFTLRRLILSEEIQNPYRELLRIRAAGGDAYPRVQRVGERGVRLVLPAPHPPLLRALSLIPILPEHRLRESLELGLLHLAWRAADPPREVVGTGPFRLEAVLPGEEVRLRRNIHYWEKGADGSTLPRIHQLVYRILRDAVQAFLDGKVDLLIADAERLREIRAHRGSASFIVQEAGPVPESTFLAFQHGRDPLGRLFARKEFRQAVSHGLHRRRMIQEVQGGLGRSQWSPISEANPYFHHGGVRTYPFDPATASRLLSDLGVVDRDGDGVRETREGIPVSFQLLVGLTRGGTYDIARRVAEDLQALGIQAHLRPLNLDRLADPLRSGQWDALVHTTPEAYDPQYLSRIWSSDGEMRLWAPPGIEPASPWQIEIDEIFREAGQELDDEKRRAFYRRFQEIAAEEVPLIYTIQRVPAVAYHRRVKNLQPSAVGILHNIARVTVRP